MTEESQFGWRRFQAPKRLGKGFERFVAAIQKKLEAVDAQVQWDEWIRGRQYDVTIRAGADADTSLAVIECRDYPKKTIRPTDVDAFVTKARRVNASRAVIVTSGRFSSGAVRAAKEHGVELWTLKEFVEDWPPQFEEEPVNALNIRNVEFGSLAGEKYALPGPEESVLSESILVNSRGQRMSFDEICRRLQPEILGRVRSAAGYQRFRFKTPGFSVILQGQDPRPLAIFVFEAGMATVTGIRRVRPPVNVPYRRRYEYSRVDSPDRSSFAEVDLPIGLDTVMRPGRFYRDGDGLTFKCLGVDGDKLSMVMLLPAGLPGGVRAIESWQSLTAAHGRFVEIEDRQECSKLEEQAQRIPRAQAG